MRQFDYRRAWHEAAKPAYQALPQDVRDLLAYTTEATEAEGLHQGKNLEMIWPNPEGQYADLRARFERFDSEYLALAAQAIYSVGHWRPSDASIDVPGRDSGATWKFSHYADQVLRARFNIGTSDYSPKSGAVSIRLIEGAFRVCYGSANMWTWHEVSPATAAGLKFAEAVQSDLWAALPAATKTCADHDARDSAAYRFMESIKADRSGWPQGSWQMLTNTERYMVEESEIIKAANDPQAFNPEKEKARVLARAAKARAVLEVETAGYVWLLDHGCRIDNAIFYSHTGRWCFGWYRDLTPAAISQWLEVLTEFPYAYDIKGYTPAEVTK